MPELPEVETYRRYFEETALGQTVLYMEVEDSRQLSTDEHLLREAVLGKRFEKTRRIGKHFLITLSSGQVLVLHFGMTGDLAYYRDVVDTPRFARIQFVFQNGYRLAFVDPRKFGRIGLAGSEETYIREKNLGPDALDITVAQLQAGLERRKAPVKALLLDQKLLAGIGNWIADEVLFQAGIFPAQPSNTLRPEAVARLHAAIHLVLETAIEREAVYPDFPRHFLIHARGWENAPAPAAQRQVCPHHQTALTLGKVGGRTTYFCPFCQPG